MLSNVLSGELVAFNIVCRIALLNAFCVAVTDCPDADDVLIRDISATFPKG